MTNKPNDENSDISHLPPQKDIFLVKPIILVVVLFFIEVVLWYIDASDVFLFIFLINCSALIIAAAFLIVGIKYIAHRYYKSAISLILIIPVLMLVFGLPLIDEKNLGTRDIAYHIKFALHEKQYLEAIKLTQPDKKGFRYEEFIWSFRFGGEGTRLVYDESDEMGLPQDHRSQAWWKNIDEHSRRYFETCLSGIYEIKSHFYVVRLVCG